MFIQMFIQHTPLIDFAAESCGETYGERNWRFGIA